MPLPGRTEIAAYDAVMALLIQKRILSLSSTANSERDVTWCGILCIIDIISFQEIFDFVLLILPVLPVCENDILRCVRAGERTPSSARYDAVVTMHYVCHVVCFLRIIRLLQQGRSDSREEGLEGGRKLRRGQKACFQNGIS